jgi:ribosomal protein S27E
MSEEIFCPNCESTQIVTNDKGFGLVKAAAGGYLFGPVGLLGGVIGSKKIKLNCLICGHTWILTKNMAAKLKKRKRRPN